jgi:hypothetical protein
VTRAPFDSDERSPQRVLRREAFPSDQPRARGRTVPTGDLGGQRQELFVEALLRKEVAEQVRPAFDQDQIARVSGQPQRHELLLERVHGHDGYRVTFRELATTLKPHS